MYDDHMYCDVCRRHERSCWCFEGRPPELLEQDLAEAAERGLCEGHGHIFVVAELYKRGMDWARRAGLARNEFTVVLQGGRLSGLHAPDEVAVLSHPDTETFHEVRYLRSAGVKVWDVS